jgi:hypothetical protein
VGVETGSEDDPRQPPDGGIHLSLTDCGGYGSGAVPQNGKTYAENQPADQGHTERARLGVKLDQAKSSQRMDTDHASHHGGDHDLYHAKITEQELPDDHIVFGDIPFLKQEAEEKADSQTDKQLQGFVTVKGGEHVQPPRAYLM